jgi:hypothetical protein
MKVRIIRKINIWIWAILLFIACACGQKNEAPKDAPLEIKKTKQSAWRWDYKVLMPVLLKENDTTNYAQGVDTLYPGQTFKARLFKPSLHMIDSTGKDMIQEFRDYIFEIKKKENADYAQNNSWTKMTQYFRVLNDTAYIQIPVDKLIADADNKIEWKAGYNVIFAKNNADTLYVISGTWHIGKK